MLIPLLLIAATMATALAQPKWFSVTTTNCAKRFIGLQEFLYITAAGNSRPNHVVSRLQQNAISYPAFFDEKNELSSLPQPHNSSHRLDQPKPNATATGIYATTAQTLLATPSIVSHNQNDSRHTRNHTQPLPAPGALRSTDPKHCDVITNDVIALQRCIIALCFSAIIVNLIQFFLDTLGTSKKWLATFRSHAIGNILGVLLTIVIIGISYVVSSSLEKNQLRLARLDDPPASLEQVQPQPRHIEVRFELSYYLVTLAGMLGLIASACNLLRRPHSYYFTRIDVSEHPELSTPLDDNNLESMWSHASGLGLPPIPPPPYSP